MPPISGTRHTVVYLYCVNDEPANPIGTPLTLATETWTDRKTGKTYRVEGGWTRDGRLAHVGITAADGGSIGPDLWRRVPLAALMGPLADAVADLRRAEDANRQPPVAPVAFFTGRQPPERRKRGRPPKVPHDHYERVAGEYRAATAVAGSTTARNYAVAVAAALGEPMGTPAAERAAAARVRKWVAECRRRGLLPPA